MSSSDCNAALALAGGGFLSVAVQSGLTSGLLAANCKKNGGLAPVTLQGSKLLERFAHISGVSGGAWFSCELIYSERFLKLIESMAYTPENAGVQFDRDWIAGWLSIGKRDPVLFKVLAEIAGTAQGAALKQTILEVGYFLSTGFNWNNYVATLLRETADIDDKKTMGSQVQGWAAGKTWLVGNSLGLPTGKNGFEKAVVYPAGGKNYDSSRNRVSYKVQATQDESGSRAPAYIPARFNVTLDAGVDAPAPVTYVAATALNPSTALFYSGSGYGEGLFGCCHTQTFKGTTAPLLNFKNFNDFPGFLPLAEVVACSSSFLGDIAMMSSEASSTDPFEQLAEMTNGDFSTWAGSAAHEQGLTKPNILVDDIYSSRRVTQQNFTGLVQNDVRLTIDGGFTDVTGIANAVAAGSTDIVSIINLTGTDGAVVPDEVINLFSSGSTCGFQAFKRFASTRDSDGAADASVNVCFEIFQNAQSDARAQYDSMFKTGSLKVDTVDTKQLTSIVVGTFTNVRTKESQFFGIEEGRPVNLHLVSVTSKLNLGEFVDFHDYSILVQEIVNTLLNPENSCHVDNTLLPFFIGSAPAVSSKKSSKNWSHLGA